MSSEIEALLALFELGIGHDVSIYGDLYIRSLEDGRYAVGRYTVQGFEELFESLILAIDRFIELRHQLQFGSEYENR